MNMEPAISLPEPIRSMAEQYRNGATLAQIGLAFGFSTSHVHQLFKRHGVPKRLKGTSPRKHHLDAATIVNQYKSGSTMVQLGRMYGVSTSHIHGILKANGISRRDRPVAPLTNQVILHALIVDYQAGKPCCDIAQEQGLTTWRVKKILAEHGVHKTKRLLRLEENRARANAMIDCYKNGMTLHDIAGQFGVSRQRVQQIFKQYAVARSDRGCRICGSCLDLQDEDVQHSLNSLVRTIDHMDKHQRDQLVIALYRAGETADELGVRFGVSRQRILQILDKHQVARQERGCPVCALGQLPASMHLLVETDGFGVNPSEEFGLTLKPG